MRITVATRRDSTRDPHARALFTMLADAGHDVSVVRATPGPLGAWTDVHTHPMPPDPPPGFMGRVLRRVVGRPVQPDPDPRFWDRLRTCRPNLQYVTRADDLDLVDPDLCPVVRSPGWPTIRNDLIQVAPQAPDLAVDQPPSDNHTPRDDRGPWRPAADRHRGRHVVVAARVTPTNPSRYLIEALERSGARVTVMDGTLDWEGLSEDADGVVVVESPYPALEEIGVRPASVPVLFWVHHGEHHLPANLRLASRYGADAVLLAHSWHLAHRFSMPVHRFPFGVDPVLFDGGRPWQDRDLDVSMIAAGFQADGPRYPQRREWAQRLLPALGPRALLEYGLPPTDMAEVYGRSRVVLNDGGTRHYPITMRVFEAIGAGARLLTDSLPGMDQLFTPDEHYATLDGSDIVTQVEGHARAGASEEQARRAYVRALARHTYDHRVDELMEAFATTAPAGPRRDRRPDDPLSALVHADVEVQTVGALGTTLDLPDRAVRQGDDARDRMTNGRFDAVVVAEPVDDPREVLAAARRYVYAPRRLADDLEPALRAVHATVDRREDGNLVRFDLHAPGYRMRPDDHPLASG